MLKYLVQLERNDGHNLSDFIPSVATSTVIRLPDFGGLASETERAAAMSLSFIALPLSSPR
ncbi:hypothetical protein [Paenibacillus taichungensis]|uniref:hypothetical protein n=1 Tax=Paenibacillus taichungensis TaxID=484184 RepID=UPI0015C5FC1F|nr:hypothetical protein [Paenibacillus taichungensis]